MDVPCLAVLALRDGEDAVPEVDVDPVESELLDLAEAGLEREGDRRPVLLRDGSLQACLLVLGQEPDPGIVLAKEEEPLSRRASARS